MAQKKFTVFHSIKIAFVSDVISLGFPSENARFWDESRWWTYDFENSTSFRFLCHTQVVSAFYIFFFFLLWFSLAPDWKDAQACDKLTFQLSVIVNTNGCMFMRQILWNIWSISRTICTRFSCALLCFDHIIVLIRVCYLPIFVKVACLPQFQWSNRTVRG